MKKKILLIHPVIYGRLVYHNRIQALIIALKNIYRCECHAVIYGDKIPASYFYPILKKNKLPSDNFTTGKFLEKNHSKIIQHLKKFSDSIFNLSDFITLDDENEAKKVIYELKNPISYEDFVNIHINSINVGQDAWQSLQYHLKIGKFDPISISENSIAFMFLYSGILIGLSIDRIFSQRYDLVVSDEIKDIEWGIVTKAALNQNISVLRPNRLTYLDELYFFLNFYSSKDEIKKNHPQFPKEQEYLNVKDKKIDFLKKIFLLYKIIIGPKNNFCKLRNLNLSRAYCSLLATRSILLKEIDNLLFEKNKNLFSKNKKNVVIFTHACFDASIVYGDKLYDTYEDWLEATYIEALKITQVNWIFRVHPRESHDDININSNTSIYLQMLKNKYPSDNIKIMEPSVNISRLNLIFNVDYCVTCGGTVGAEMAPLGKVVISAARAGYSYLEYIYSPETKSDYIFLLQNLIKIEKPNEKYKNNAFAFFALLLDKKRCLNLKLLFTKPCSRDLTLDKRELDIFINKKEIINFIKCNFDKYLD